MSDGQGEATDGKAGQSVGGAHPDDTCGALAGIARGEQTAFIDGGVTSRNVVVVDHIERRWGKRRSRVGGATTEIEGFVVRPGSIGAELETQGADALADAQQADEGGATTGIGGVAGSGFVEQIVEWASFVERSNQPVEFTIGDLDDGFGGALGTDDFGVQHHGFVGAQPERQTVQRYEVDGARRPGNDDFAFVDGIADMQGTQAPIFSSGVGLSLNSGNAGDRIGSGHDGESS